VGACAAFGSDRVYDVPTRYREVVLTVSKYQKWDCAVSFAKCKPEFTPVIPNRSHWHNL